MSANDLEPLVQVEYRDIAWVGYLSTLALQERQQAAQPPLL